MTRSRKKTPCGHYVKKDTWYKNVFNRKIRRNPINWDEGVSSMPDGMAYRKANESWLIDDYRVVGITFDDYRDPDADEAEQRNYYERFCIRK